jgi:hypothetical protein
MIEELHQNLQAFVASQFFVEITVRSLGLGEAAKSLCPFFHDLSIDLAGRYSERI